MVRRQRFDERLVTSNAYEFEQLAYQMRRGNPGISIDNNPSYPRLHERKFRSAYGCTSTVCATAWLLVIDGWRNKPSGATKVQFLWAFHLLKSYDTEINLASNVRVDEKTFRSWSWFFLEELTDRKAEIINWENRKINDIGNDCLVSVDGTDFQLAYGKNKRKFWDYKFKGPGLRYEVAVCLRTSDIVWGYGPHLPGLYNDLQIFRKAMIRELEPGERAEADDGYIGECPQHIKCSNGITRREDRERLNQRQRNRHETVNERFKNFGCMSKKFRHSPAKHGICFDCVIILTQLAIEQGEELFPIEYRDGLTDIEAGL